MPIAEEAHAFIDSAIEWVKARFHEATDFLKSEGQKVIVLFAQTDIGTKLLNMMSALWSQTASGSDKMNAVVAAAVDIGEKFLTGGGWAGLFASAADLVRAAAQLLFGDLKKRMQELAAA